MIRSLLSACVFLLIASCLEAGIPAKSERADPLTDDDYAVYSQVLRDTVAGDGKRVAWILKFTNRDEADGTLHYKEGKLVPMTLDERSEYLRQQLPGLMTSACEDYFSRNVLSLTLTRRLKLPVAYRLINDRLRSQHRAMFRADRASELAWLSGVGFNEQHDQALVNLRTSGGTDGESTYYLLTRAAHGWKIAARFVNRGVA